MREPMSDNNAPLLPPQSLLERLKDYGQEDIFALWDELSPEERDILVKDIEFFLGIKTSVLLAYQSFGVVYGDLSTSPLYVYSSIFVGKLQNHQNPDTIFGFIFINLLDLNSDSIAQICHYCSDC